MNRSEVNKLRADVELLAGASPAAMKAPDDVPAAVWQRVLEILATLPPEAFAPWNDLEHVAAWVAQQTPAVLNHYPDACIAAYLQAHAEQDGGPVPGWLYRWGELSDATLALIPQDCPAEDFPAALEAFHRAAELELAAAGGPVP